MTDHVADLLPWYINGRLNAEERAKVMHHLQHCVRCTAELNLQQQLQAAITAPVKVEIAPQPSFNKLWERIITEDHPHVDRAIRTSLITRLPFEGFSHWMRTYWMPVTLATQAALIIVLIGLIVIKQQAPPNDDAAYRTVTSNAPINGTVFHVVFDDATRLADIKDILLRSNLQVISGPTAAGVYSLTPTNEQLSIANQQTVKSLRDDPRVRFAEISHE